MKTVWMVEKRGIYSHGILGVFATEHEARACAEKATVNTRHMKDGDGYHLFMLMRCELGSGPVDVAEWSGEQRWRETGTYLAEPYSWHDAR